MVLPVTYFIQIQLFGLQLKKICVGFSAFFKLLAAVGRDIHSCGQPHKDKNIALQTFFPIHT